MQLPLCWDFFMACPLFGAAGTPKKNKNYPFAENSRLGKEAYFTHLPTHAPELLMFAKLNFYWLLPFVFAAFATQADFWQRPTKSQFFPPFLEELRARVQKYAAEIASEKVYLQTDKPLYEAGEIIWFSAYVRDARNLSPAVSRILYVELLAPNGAQIEKRSLIAFDGQAAGDFELKKNAAGGTYKLRAYTQWQKNTNTVFEREITVQTAIIPRLQMRVDFEREGYGAGDEVAAEIQLRQADNSPLAEKTFSYTVFLDGKSVARREAKTDGEGKARINYRLPRSLASSDALINVQIDYRGQTESIARAVPISLGNIDLQFFAEGGRLCADAEQIIAFKALDENGSPCDVEGIIKDSKGNTVASFSSYHDGMGSLPLQLKSGETYYAQVQAPAGVKKTFALPKAQTEIFALRLLSQNSQNLNLQIQSPKATKAYLVLHNNGDVLHSEQLNLQKGSNAISINTSQMPMGIAQLTLFDADEQPQAERLVFLQREKRLSVDIQTDKSQYLPRELVKMRIQVHDEQQKPVEGAFSLAVVDEKLLSFADDRQGNILASLLLQSELKGDINEPNFYFDMESDSLRPLAHIQRPQALDNLLLTQGWRRFTLQNAAGMPIKPMFVQEKGEFRGKIVDMYGEPIANLPLHATSKSSGSDSTRTDSAGHFVFKNLALYETFSLESADKKTPLEHSYNRISAFNFSADGQPLKAYRSHPLRGRVLRAEGAPPINYAEVTVFSNSYLFGSVVPDEDGYFTIDMQEAYSTELKIQYQSAHYSSYIDTKEIRSDSLFTFKIGLRITDMELELPSVEVVSENYRERRVMSSITRSAPPMYDNMSARTGSASRKEKKAKAPKKTKAAPVQETAPELAEELPIVERPRPQQTTPPSSPSSTNYYRPREFYAPRYEKIDRSQPLQRNDLRSTVYWNPRLRTNAEGIAEIEFYHSDELSTFTTQLEGISHDGKIALHRTRYSSLQPIEISAKIPSELLAGDLLRLPITLHNRGEATIGRFTLQLPKNLRLLLPASDTLHLPANGSRVLLLPCEVLSSSEGSDSLHISFVTPKCGDFFAAPIRSRPRGFLHHQTFAGKTLKASHNLHINEAIKGSAKLQLRIHSAPNDEMQSTLQAMLRMPSGCFEQTSSTNYPNVLAMQLLQKNPISPELRQTMQAHLQTGYQKLIGYECAGGGFSWYGKDPASEGMTAYGLMQFHEMAKVYDVDKALLERTEKWLLNRRDGKGGWKLSENYTSTWGNTDLAEVYITWAMSECIDNSKKLKREIEASAKSAEKSKDPYLLALSALSLYNVEDSARAREIVQNLLTQRDSAYSLSGKIGSITNSQGKALRIETTALVALAVLRDPALKQHIEPLINYLQSAKDFYGYGSTQGTILYLKAFALYQKMQPQADKNGTLLVRINGQEAARIKYLVGQPINVPALSCPETNGKQSVEILFEHTDSPLPYELQFHYHSRLPANQADCALRLHTQFAQDSAKTGEILRLSARLKNISKENTTMAIAQIGIPAGLTLPIWQLRELQKRKAFSFYEIHEGLLVLHFERLKAGEERSINLDLKADVAGTYTAQAACAYLYYQHEKRQWCEPLKVDIY